MWRMLSYVAAILKAKNTGFQGRRGVNNVNAQGRGRGLFRRDIELYFLFIA